MKNIHISIVSPVYMAEGLVFLLVDAIEKNIKKISLAYEIILVDDGSTDKSWQQIESVCEKNKQVKGLKLSRNFGQHNAIFAGLAEAKGEWVIVMDCDLQDRPDQFELLYNKASEGHKIVLAQRKIRHDSFIKKFFSKQFYKIFSFLTDTQQDASVANFGIYHKMVIQALLQIKDQEKYFPAMVQWLGFKSVKVEVLHGKREIGKTSYSFKKLLFLASNTILSFSNKPLRITAFLGLIISGLSLVVGLIQFIRYLNGVITELGFTSLILSIWFLCGFIIFILGLIGIYLGKVFEKVKDRQSFIIEERLND